MTTIQIKDIEQCFPVRLIDFQFFNNFFPFLLLNLVRMVNNVMMKFFLMMEFFF